MSRLSSLFSAAAAATRPTRRDMFRSPWRLLAAVLLIALPIAYAVGLGAWDASTAPEYADRQNVTHVSTEQACAGSADGDTADPGATHRCPTDAAGVPSVPTKEQFAAALPEGTTAEPFIDANGAATTPDGHSVDAALQQVPDFALALHKPRDLAKGEAFLPDEDAAALNLSVGDTFTFTPDPQSPVSHAVTLTFAGTTPHYRGIVGAGTFGTAADFYGIPYSSGLTWLLQESQPMTWAEAQRAYDAGFNLSNYSWADNPPAGAPAGVTDNYPRDGELHAVDYTGGFDEAIWMLIAIIAYLVGFFLILLVISPVFTLAIGRHTRLFALMGAQGASRRHLGWAVLVFGLVAGLLGTALGEILSLLSRVLWQLKFPGWAFHLAWGWVVGAAAVGIVGSVLAASIPAWLAGRTSLTGAMAGGTPDKMVRWRSRMLIGPFLLAVAVAGAIAHGVATASVRPDQDALWSTVLMLLGVSGMALSAPALVFGVGALLGRGPIAPRMAGRGLTRRSMHAIPAVAALLCLSGLATTFTVQSSADNSLVADLNQRVLPATVATLSIGSDAAETSAQEATSKLDLARDRVVAAAGQPSTEIPLRGVPDYDTLVNYYGKTDLGQLGAARLAFPDAVGCDSSMAAEPTDQRDSRGRDPYADPDAARACLGTLAARQGRVGQLGLSSLLLVGGPELLDVVGFDSPADRDAARETLLHGGVVAPHGTGLAGLPQARLTGERFRGPVDTADPSTYSDPTPAEATEATLPFAEALPVWAQGLYLLSPQAADALELPVVDLGSALVFDDPITTAEAAQLYGTDPAERKQIASITTSADPFADARTAWTVPLILGGAALVILVLIIALATPGLRRESAVLSTLGAGPTFGARMAAWQTGVVAAMGLGGGVLAGHCAALAYASRDKYTVAGELYRLGSASFVRVDWPLVVVTAAVSLLTAAVAYAAHRSTGATTPREDRSLA